jgi:hypothetical protein
MARRKLEPRYVLIHGRRDNFETLTRRREKRAELALPDERLMSFDRLTPAKNSVLYSTVRKRQGAAIFGATADKPEALLEWFPQALLFGFWQSHLGRRCRPSSLLRRAKTLGIMPDGAYVQALKTMSTRGWNRREPVRLPQAETPAALARAVQLLKHSGITSIRSLMTPDSHQVL